MRKKIIISSVIIAVLGLVVAINILAGTRFYNFAKSGWEHSRLDDARTKWEKNGYTSYVMDVTTSQHHCRLDRDKVFRVMVIDEKIIAMRATDNPNTELGPRLCQDYTVTDIFRSIDKAASSGNTLSVSYNKSLGHPTAYFTDSGDIDYYFRWELIQFSTDLDTYADQQTREALIAERR